ncbi:MAG: outer membrane scaffolding protein for murein synthesis (MipA/OmpV family), partial [Cyclobacteriaceae bacterium]
MIALVPVLAQKKIKYQADSLINQGRNKESIQFLWPNVIFVQESTTVTNDSSVYYKSQNQMESYFNVKIVDD